MYCSKIKSKLTEKRTVKGYSGIPSQEKGVGRDKLRQYGREKRERREEHSSYDSVACPCSKILLGVPIKVTEF